MKWPSLQEIQDFEGPLLGRRVCTCLWVGIWNELTSFVFLPLCEVFFSFLVGRHPLLSRGVASIFSTLSVGFMWNNPAIRIHTSSNTHTVCRIKATELLKFRQHHLPPLQAYPSGCYVDPGRCAQVFHSLMTARPEWSLSLLRDFLWCEGGMSSCCRKLSVEVISTVQGNDCCLLKCHQMDWH